MRKIPRVLPRGRGALARDVVLLSQRARLLEAVADAAAAKGYAAMTLSDITNRAGVSRATFYEQFASKEECFLAAYEQAADAHRQHMLAAIASVETIEDRVRAGVHAYLEVLEQEPVYAHAFFIQVRAAGARAADLRQSVIDGHVRLLRDWHRLAGGAELPEELYSAAVGGVDEIVTARLHAGRRIIASELEGAIVDYLQRVLGLQADRPAEAGRRTARRSSPAARAHRRPRASSSGARGRPPPNGMASPP